ncbi:MAG: TonB-dependent receptor [Bacteroides sp.]|nr:TonB-dependent receptor [Bacteroides sp.]
MSLALGIADMSASHTDVRLDVKVMDASTSSPLEFVAVSLDGGNRSGIKGGYTDSRGVFSIKLPAGRYTMELNLVGFRPVRRIIELNKPVETIAMSLESVESLDEVVVTAREAHTATSASLIDTTAMRHLQPSSFTDLLSLLPGGVTKDPSMGGVNAITLRQATNIYDNDDYATSSLGTSFIVDGVPVNTNSQLQSTPDSNQGDRIAIGKGVDMRTISTDDIEKVEIIRGIPSVEYGELTSGLVNIKRKSGVSRLEARFKADTQSQLFYAGKGFAIDPSWILNVGADYLDSKIDPRNNRENFKRVTASVRSDKRWNNDSHNITLNSSVSYSGTFERDENDPDLTVNNTIDAYRSDNHTIRLNNTLNYRPVVQKFIRELNLTTGLSYSDEHLSQQKHVTSSSVMPLPISTTPGSNYVGYLPMLYLADHDVYGKPFTVFTKLSGRFHASSRTVSEDIKAGIEWDMNKNYGAGPVYDVTRPISAGNTSRPRAYSDIPAMHQFSAYVESQSTLHAGLHTVTLIAGLRETQLLHLDSRYALHGKPYLDPRINATWLPAPTYLRGHAIRWELAGGFGWHTKMPVASYLYPNKRYTDFGQLNYFHNEEAYRVMNVKTFVEDMTNYDLLAARNFKWEVRADISYRDNRLSISYFRENMKDGFRSTGFVSRYQYNRYDASGFDPYAADRAPMIEELPYVTETYLGVKSKTTNGSRTKKEGIEYTFQSRRLPKISTRVTVTGAYFRTINSNSQALWYKPNVVANGKTLQYVGLYDDVDGSEYRSFNTNILFDTDISRLGLNFSIGLQNVWFTSRRTLRRDGVPVQYIDVNGDMHPYTAESAADPYLKQLIRVFSESSFKRNTVPSETTVNFKATKTFWAKRIGLAVYVNRLLYFAPEYDSYGATIRRYSSPYFGMELNLKI